MEISIKWNICRVCLQEQKEIHTKSNSESDIQFVNLFNKKLDVQIFELFGVSMKPDDALPDKICGKCATIVNNAVQLRKTCCSSNTYLQSILSRAKSASTLLKSEIPTCTTIILTNVDSGYNKDSKTQPSILKDDIDQQYEYGTACNNKNKNDTQTRHILYSLEHQEDEQLQLELNHDISDCTVEMEELIEMDEDELCAETLTDDADDPISMFENVAQNKENSNLNKSEFSRSRKLCENDSFSQQRNIKVEQYNSNANDSDPLKRDKSGQVDPNNCDEDLKENEESVSEKYLEFVIDQEENTESNTDESVIIDLEEEINNNEDQVQVSSTVETNEIEYYDDSSNISNLSNDLDKERLTNKNSSIRTISSTKPFEASNEPYSHYRKTFQKHSTIEGNKRPIVFSKRKIKKGLLKSATYEPAQVCFCEICGNQFANQNQMKLHMNIHLQYKNHQCELCFKRFITACNLQAHMRIHTGEKPYECKHCSRRFSDRSSHIRHERTHTNEKPFECFDCGKSFSLATTLQNHMKVHSNERSFRCEPCGKSFKLAHHLKKHESTSLHRSTLQIAENGS